MTTKPVSIRRWLTMLSALMSLIGCVSSTDTSSSHPSHHSLSNSSASSLAHIPATSSSNSTAAIQSSSISNAATSSSSTGQSSSTTTCNFDDVQTIFADHNCLACHSTEQAGLYGGGLALDDEGLGKNLLGTTTEKGGLACAEEQLIDPDNIENSLFLKLIDTEKHATLKAEGCDRTLMPPFGDAVSQQGITCITSWVESVIDTEDPTPPANTESKPFAPNTAGAALSRAKLILHGGPVTDAELTFVGGSEANLTAKDLRNVISQWQSSAEYETKIKSFLTLALQQTNKPDTLLTEQFNNVRGEAIGKSRLLRNMEEMFPRTAWEIVKTNDDFRKVVTTSEWFVTTGMLSALVYTEKPQQTPGRDYLRRSAQNDQFKNFEHLTDDDFNDWRKVTFTRTETPQNYANSAAFAQRMRDIPHGSEVSLRMPRVGFFSTPAFYDNWATNDDNQFRVTTQQTLITALDKPISADDATEHLTVKGISQDHADPESACFQCHRHMDPMRQVFAKYQVTRNRSKPTNDNAQPSFSFLGVAENFDTVEEFADIVANHPEFPNAWVQKLCMWANSQRCNPADLEFQRLSNNFAQQFSFNTLIRQFFSSPLFTAVNRVKSHETHEYLVSLTRGNHYCKAMDARVKALTETNNTKGKLSLCNDRDELGIVAPDVFARGQADFIQSTQISGFESKAIDIQCAKAAGSVFANNDSKIIDTTQGKNPALQQLVQYVMGVPPSHHRYRDLLTQITRVYDIAFHKTACSGDPADQSNEISCGYGKSQGDALRVAWFTACTSPEIISVGM